MKAVPLAVAVFCSVVFGQMVTPEMRTAASDAYQKQDWKAAATAYEAIVKVEDKNAGANYRLMTHYVGGLVAGKMVLDSESTQTARKRSRG